ncbi:uncharacterized protein LOC111087176 isoform X1 [Limulus polyphemus]|uniref:Uncharacterized protein LOC111087176 isoform X1 n=1 Tax=Limulus polyphemus TaxID=6850 RepID=A0ABM1SYB7_LIMPO|nr:uncharacterized protein LOC111087176 isoform X1 [Limulus polyphemus]
MADLASRLITFSVSPSTSDAHQKHLKDDKLNQDCSDCQNILNDMNTFHDELKKIIKEDETVRTHLIESFPVLTSSREESIKFLKKIDIKKDENSSGVKSSKIATSLNKISKIRKQVSTSGETLAPITGGLSLDLPEGGVTLQAAGELIAIGANVTGSIINKTKCKEIKTILVKDKKETDEFLKDMETLECCDETREKLLKEADEFIDILENGVNAGKSLAGHLEKAVEFVQNLAHLEEVTLESADEVLKKTFIISTVKTPCDQVDLNSPSSPISPNINQVGEVSKLRASGLNITTSSLPPSVRIALGTVATALEVVNNIFSSENIEEDDKNGLQDRITELVKEITLEKEEIEKVHEHIKA